MGESWTVPGHGDDEVGDPIGDDDHFECDLLANGRQSGRPNRPVVALVGTDPPVVRLPNR